MSKQLRLNWNAQALVDDDDYEWLSQRSWSRSETGPVTTVLDDDGEKQIPMARAIMNALPDETVVYANPVNPLDNRKCNLRLVSPKRGFFDRWFRPNATPGLRGVSWHRLRRRYHVQARYRKRHYDLGYYQDPREAGMVFDAAARHLGGFFARRNFPARPIPPELAEKVAALLARQHKVR